MKRYTRDEFFTWQHACSPIEVDEKIEELEAKIKQLQKTEQNNAYVKCHKNEFENIICDMESALYASPEITKNILSKSIKSVKAYIDENFAIKEQYENNR